MRARTTVYRGRTWIRGGPVSRLNVRCSMICRGRTPRPHPAPAPCASTPADLRRAIEIDAQRRPARRLRAEAIPERVPRALWLRTPADLGDLRQPGEREVF